MRMTKDKKLFPLFTDLTKKKVVVFGAGTIATRRIKTLLPFVGDLHVIAPKASKEVLELASANMVSYHRKSYERQDISGADIVIAATDHQQINEDIYSICKRHGILVNVASDQTMCDFHFPAIVEKDPIIIGINAGGKDHKLVKEVRIEIEEILKSSEEGLQ